jgi:hypothetical protein
MSLYDVNQHHRAHDSRPKLKYDTWKTLTRDDQVLWDQLSDTAKSAIIRNHSAGRHDNRQPTASSSSPPVYQPIKKPIRQANIHEAESSDDSDFMDAVQAPDDNISDTTLLINAATQEKQLCPGDIRTVLSSSAAKKRNPKNVRIQTHEGNVHELVTYRVSNHRGTSVGRRGALVDRGANGWWTRWQ